MGDILKFERKAAPENKEDQIITKQLTLSQQIFSFEQVTRMMDKSHYHINQQQKRIEYLETLLRNKDNVIDCYKISVRAKETLINLLEEKIKGLCDE